MLHPNEFFTQVHWIAVAKTFMSTSLDALYKWQAAKRAPSPVPQRALAKNIRLHLHLLPQTLEQPTIQGALPDAGNASNDVQVYVESLEGELQSITAQLLKSQKLLFEANVEQQRFRSALSRARDLQENLLPNSAPQIEGLDIYAQSQPAHEINGDFYDFINLEPANLTFTVGDISGKGMSAGLLMTMTRKVLRTGFKVLERPTPRLILDYCNLDLYEELTNTGMFATTFVGQFASESRMLQYANAGHSPVILRPANGRAKILHADDAPIGVLAESYSTDHRIRLLPGDLLIIGTDGITDARNKQGEMFGQEQLLKLIDQHADKSASEIADIVFDSISSFEDGCSQDDDQTLMILKGV